MKTLAESVDSLARTIAEKTGEPIQKVIDCAALPMLLSAVNDHDVEDWIIENVQARP